MKVINPTVIIEEPIDGKAILARIERAGRTCYKSEERINSESSEKFIRMLLKHGHESVLEHETITVRIICDRGVTHEIVRHRIGSYSQESTRYCNYSQDKFGNEITCIRPSFWRDAPEMMKTWEGAMEQAESAYFKLIDAHATAQEARSVLPNSLKTEIVVTYNIREWRHFLKLRTSHLAHPQMREVAVEILKIFAAEIPILFGDIPMSESVPSLS